MIDHKEIEKAKNLLASQGYLVFVLNAKDVGVLLQANNNEPYRLPLFGEVELERLANKTIEKIVSDEGIGKFVNPAGIAKVAYDIWRGEIKKHTLSIDDSIPVGWNLTIDGKKISDDVFQEQRVGWDPWDRLALIEELKSLKKTATDGDVPIIDKNIAYLQSLGDKYVWSDTSTNNFVAYSDNPICFRDICIDVLEESHQLHS